MNYGMGGLISAHVDSNNWITNQDNEGLQTSENNKYGGARFITFMIYLSDVQSGGRTGNFDTINSCSEIYFYLNNSCTKTMFQ